jgi:hypothetical protein
MKSRRSSNIIHEPGWMIPATDQLKFSVNKKNQLYYLEEFGFRSIQFT